MARIPESIDKYRVESLIASGGMGQVYKAEHPTLKRPVIIKKLSLGSTANLTERFRREARILMDFRNDHIVDVHDHFVKGRSNYIVMEYVDGVSVKDLLETQRYIDNASAAYIALYTARALEYAHRKSVIHRDIKPGNILISRDGDVKLADFGIASSRESNDETLTSEGMTLGTPSYMAPEQFRNSREVDYRADLYSLGIMLYEMLTGRKPYGGGFSPELIQQIQKGKYPRPRKLNPAIEPQLERIIRKLIRPNAARRFNDAGHLRKRLERYLHRYYPDQIKNRLAAYVQLAELPRLGMRKQKPGVFRILLLAAGVAALAGVVTVDVLSGIHNRVLYPAKFGQLQLVVENLPGSTSIIPRPASSIYTDDNDEIPLISRKVIYREHPAGDEQGYSSLPLVLPEGRYRIKTNIDGQIVWKSFFLSSWSDEQQQRRIYLSPLPPLPEPVRVETRPRDAVSRTSLKDRAQFQVIRSGKAVPLDEAIVISGEVHHFRVEAPGYLSQDFVLRLNDAQDVLTLAPELVPVPANLFIQIDGEGEYRVRLNGKSRVRTVNDGNISKIDINPSSRQSYRVLPGRYVVEADGKRQDGSAWRDSRVLELVSETTVRLRINPDSGTIEQIR